MVLDEGFTGIDEEYGQSFSRLGIAEKGCLTLKISVHTPGGHSSAPPKNTGIGIMSRILVEMENNPFEASLEETNPLLTYLECAAEQGSMSTDLVHSIRRKECWSSLAREVGRDKLMSTFLGTTQVRNALPLSSLNIRPSTLSTVESSLMPCPR